MTKKKNPDGKEIRLYPPPPKDFDPFAASEKDLIKHGLPLRPDSRTQPVTAGLWDRRAASYRNFDHIEPRLDTTTAFKKPTFTTLDTSLYLCGYELFSSSAPFTILFATWTVPNLRFTPSPRGATENYFETFVALGFLDIHVEMSVDFDQNVTSHLWAQGIGNIDMPVRPGDVMSVILCLQTNEAGTASYFLVNETSSQTVNFTIDTGWPPAASIIAGVAISEPVLGPFPPLASFGSVYFDEISAFTTNGSPSLTSGEAINMTDRNGRTLAKPVRLTDYAFKIVFTGD